MYVLTDDDFLKLRSYRFHKDRLKQLKSISPVFIDPESLNKSIEYEEKEIKRLENVLQRRNLQIKFRN